jgi:hypothetical protein
MLLLTCFPSQTGESCPICRDTFVEEIEEFAVGDGGTMMFGRRTQDHAGMGLSEEQRRRLFNAAALLQLLEAHLREELMMLELAVRHTEGNKTSLPLTDLEKHALLKKIEIDTDQICSQPSCPICGEDYVPKEETVQIQCSHFFHESCVMPWLEMKHSCPICRFEISENIPSTDDLEKLTESEIRQRLSWHGEAASSDSSRFVLIMLLNRDSYSD